MSIEEIAFFVLGLLLSYIFFQYRRYKHKFNKVVDMYKDVKIGGKAVDKVKKKAKFTWEGWNYTEPNMKLKNAWEVHLILEEIEKTKNQIRFRVISAISNGPEVEKLNIINDKFNKMTGGWLDKSNKNLEWIIDKTEKEIRNEKIDKLLNNG